MKARHQRRMAVCVGIAWVIAGPTALLLSLAWLLWGDGPDAAAPWEAALAMACAWLLGAWGLYWTLACLCVAASRAAAGLRGTQNGAQETTGRRAASAWERRLPRRAVLAVSLSLGLSVTFTAAAHAGGPHTAPTSQVQPLESGHGAAPQWPSTSGAGSTSSSTEREPRHTPPGYSTGGSGPTLPPIWGGSQRSDNDVVVREGDSLWRIAKGRLGPDATAADIDREWRLWFHHNRSTIGPNPHLLHPGQLLRAPD